MNIKTTAEKVRKSSLERFATSAMSVFFAILLACASFPIGFAHAEEATADVVPAAETAKPDEASNTDESSVGTFEVLLSDSSGSYTDVTEFENGVTDWKVDQLRTLHVDFEFASGADKVITIYVPTGYKIVGYSAMENAPVQNSLTNIEIDPQYAEFFQSSTLVGLDGTTAWDKQLLPNPCLGHQSTAIYNARIHGGIATYTFSDATTEGQVVMTLQPQYNILSHSAETELLDSVVVTMSSAKEKGGEVASQQRSFSANVTHLTIASMSSGAVGTWVKPSGYVPYDSETGLTGQFGVLSSLVSYREDTIYGSQGFYADYWTLTVNYPKGVSFDNMINCQYLGLGDYETSEEVFSESGQVLVPGHATVSVTGDKTTGGQVIFAFTNTHFTHSSYNIELGAYFTADAALVEDENLSFEVKMDMENKGKTIQCSDKRTRQLVANDGSYMIDLGSRSVERRDIHADYPDYPYDYAMGAFLLNAKLPYSDVRLSYDFTDLNGVRGLGSPGKNVRDIEAVTSSGRTVQVKSVPDAIRYGGYYGAAITHEHLGLLDGEYIETLTCTVDLEQLTYQHAYTWGMSYYGHFVDGQEGDAVLSILNEDGSVALNDKGRELSAVDHTRIAWENSGFGYLETVVYDAAGNKATTFHPNEKLSFSGTAAGGAVWTDADSIVDPIIMISLPEGINLDTSSIRVQSGLGNHGKEWFMPSQVGTPLTAEIDGVKWTTYYFASPDPMDMVAIERLPGYTDSYINLKFDAYVSSNSPEYGQISLADCVQWDMNVTSVNGTSGKAVFGDDNYNRAGKNTETTTYKIHKTGDNFTVKPLIGLNVDLGIRVMGSGTDFFTYDTTEDSVAGLLTTESAEVEIVYENTASTDYFKGSAIYLPVPGVGNDYARFFQNIEVADPLNVENIVPFEFDTRLESLVSMVGFTTYYATSVTETNAVYDPSTNASTWTPVEANWMTYDELMAANYELSDVIFLKLVADRDIHSGESGMATFELSISENAQLDQINYWRAYSKAVTDQVDNTGVWNYSSVIAATPVNFGVSGQFFLDFDLDGCFDVSAGDEAYTDGNVTAVLSRDGGGMDNVLLTVAKDGSFRSLNKNGTDYYLKTGDYTITFENNDSLYVYSPISGECASNEKTWYNDLDPMNLKDQVATYHFTVSADTTLGTYVGVALTPEIISIDVPIKVDIALEMDGTWCTPTAINNRIINNSTCDMRVASAVTAPTDGYTLLEAGQLPSSSQSNVFGGTVRPEGGTAQDLSAISCSEAEWTMTSGFSKDGSNELALQLTGSIQNAEDFFLSPIHMFNITFVFEKATAGGE